MFFGALGNGSLSMPAQATLQRLLQGYVSYHFMPVHVSQPARAHVGRVERADARQVLLQLQSDG